MWVAIPFSRESSQPGIEPALQADSLPSGPPGNPRAKHLRIVFGCCSAAPPGEEGGGHQVEGDLTTSAPRAGNSSQSKSVMEKHQVIRTVFREEVAFGETLSNSNDSDRQG